MVSAKFYRTQCVGISRKGLNIVVKNTRKIEKYDQTTFKNGKIFNLIASRLKLQLVVSMLIGNLSEQQQQQQKRRKLMEQLSSKMLKSRRTLYNELSESNSPNNVRMVSNE
ncbi:hypothetical protein WN51_14525 [Melipona quadrifasciata]|uniref:Uncharacterized protein n=1 Tax=Melipona quadrifasciata TaxID=166423 RepID=A0A0M9A0S5_9HYME|nr:hypothetical protein WN51_14525 [Melipona quadrifasciata]